MRVLVTGGAGYIGSHTVVQLVAAGHEVVVVDNFSNAKPTVVGRLESLTGAHLEVHAFDLTDRDKVESLFAARAFDAVIHFAGLKAVGESVDVPLEYYQNNLDSTFALVRAMREGFPTSATNPYGWTKVMIEQVLRDVAGTDERWRIALLRYFNPVGAHLSGTIGEDPQGIPNNLMPFIAQVAVGKLEKLNVFGDDYETPDGTALRDYIHVEDLAAGHLAALTKLGSTTQRVSTWNLGTGHGTSVLEVLRAFEQACGHELPYEVVARRAGDIAASYADPSRAERELGWRATRTIEDMCADQWRWQRGNPLGYPD